MRIALAVIVLVAAGWAFRADLPFFHGQVGSAKGAEAWLTGRGDKEFVGGSPMNPPATGANCSSSHRPTGTVANPELSNQGVNTSWYNCLVEQANNTASWVCVGALTGGQLSGRVMYTLAVGSCDGTLGSS